MKKTLKTQAQSYVCDLVAYRPGTPIVVVARQHGLQPGAVIKLASNENPCGMSPKAAAAIRQSLSGGHRYPDQYELIHAIAAHHAVQPGQIVLGNGSNDVLDLAARTFLDTGSSAVSSQYAFAIYQIATQSVGAANIIVPAADYGHDLAAMRNAVTHTTKVVWIANPNNPTGTFNTYSAVKAFLEELPGTVILVLDEAYFEYLPPEGAQNAVVWLAKHPNLIVVRTFSKIYGLAGLRIGYAVAHPEVAQLMNRVRQPFNANSPAMAGARAALADEAFARSSVIANNVGRQQLLEGLHSLGLRCLPAYGNFVTFKVRSARKVCTALEKDGIIVRPLAGYGMSDWLRVTIGLKTENDMFLMQLSRILAH